MKVAIIPARGGSKRIPRKNIKEFCGKPMIAWSIAAAKASGLFERIIVSTDDKEISAIAKTYGAEIPFIRPASLSDDYIGTTAVVRHAVEWLSKNGDCPSYVCCIYATAPFVLAQDLQRGFSSMQSERCDYAFSVASYPFPIQRALRKTQKGRVEMFQPQHFTTRSQDLEEAYHDAGQFYWGTAQAWLQEKPLFSNDSVPLLLPRYRVQDIDTLEDLQRAEWMFKALQAIEG